MLETITSHNHDFAFMIEQALKAPSGHNSQPWFFKLTEKGICIYPDYSKSLPVVDPDNRELFVSIGCAVENLCIAATHKYYDPIVHFDSTTSEIQITLNRNEQCVATPLFSQIASRQTNRRVYSHKIIENHKLEKLRSLTREPGIGVHFFANGSENFNQLAALIYEGNRIQMGNASFRNELQEWIRYNKHQRDITRDGLSYSTLGALCLPQWLGSPIIKWMLTAKRQNSRDKRKIESASHLVLFTTHENNVESWINLGRTLERFHLKTTELGLAHSYMNQPNELPELTHQLTELIGLKDEYPTILIRLGYASRMPNSLRRIPRIIETINTK